MQISVTGAKKYHRRVAGVNNNNKYTQYMMNINNIFKCKIRKKISMLSEKCSRNNNLTEGINVIINSYIALN